jgi:type IV fimbrial biogenesis protein FimT
MRSAQGIALWELLGVVSIAALLAALAVPGFKEARQSAVLTAAVNQMVGSLHFARSAAILRNVPAVLCLSVEGQQCIERLEEAATGWLIFLDFQRSSPPRLDREDQRLRWVSIPADVSLQATRPALTYWPTARNGTTGTFTFCNVMRSGSTGRSVIVSQTGRPRTAESDAGECGQ